jgi:hypothetical protein
VVYGMEISMHMMVLLTMKKLPTALNIKGFRCLKDN